MPETPVQVKVWGSLACFTRPEMKVERVTYPVMTPSAARGALEAIFWKPQFDWVVEEIHVLRDIAYASFVRNEVNSRQTERVAANFGASGGYDAASDRAQRHTLALRDVAYVIRANIRLRPGATDPVAKYRDQFRRRVAAGQCFSTPYLGCREFAASFGEPDTTDVPIARTEDLGPMLLDLEYEPGGARARPRLFRAHLENGVLRVPPRFEEG
jgi:CRISPR-associated protein Cas5d